MPFRLRVFVARIDEILGWGAVCQPRAVVAYLADVRMGEERHYRIAAMRRSHDAAAW
ncbi:hypothetical protein [Pseudorhodobacter turbinis]|uniref:hypothetical protein n=1 Tax=Pseudorhodobacter turbinis TaxID=2500533 RepID=UPI00143D7719|nr:hypothetical protein [Pseudorhodobacter turbinis]